MNKTYSSQYLCKTNRLYLSTRISEHQRDMINIHNPSERKPNNTALAENAFENLHTFNFNKVEVLARQNVLKKRLLHEMIEIKKESNSLNKRSDIEHSSSKLIFMGTRKHSSKSDMYLLLFEFMRDGLIMSKGEKWMRRRKLLTPAFHFNILKDFLNVFNEQTEVFIENISNISSQPINVVPLVTDFTLYTLN
ncbi:hypothetical protein HHI36_009046, partial [Cryptolaemus montrouzieri]